MTIPVSPSSSCSRLRISVASAITTSPTDLSRTTVRHGRASVADTSLIATPIRRSPDVESQHAHVDHMNRVAT